MTRGVISVYFSILLAVAGLVAMTSYQDTLLFAKQSKQAVQMQTQHLLTLEMLYYIRNEINDGFYSNLKFEGSGWSIKVTFHTSIKEVTLYMENEDDVVVHHFSYDKECRCLTAMREDQSP